MDPGDNTALVFWSDFEKPVETFFFALTTKQKKLSITERHKILVAQVLRSFLELKRDYPFDEFELIIEGVFLWGKSTKSNVAAARGDLFRLAYLVGGIITAFQDVWTDGEVSIIKVTDWKGQLPDKVVLKEVENYIGEKPENIHMADAIGIGMNNFGRLG